MRAAKGVARADDAVEGADGRNSRSATVRPSARPRRRRVPGRAAPRGRLDRDRELDQAAAAERVPKAALPPDDRGARESARRRGDLHPAGLEGARAVALEPDPAAPRGAPATPSRHRSKPEPSARLDGEVVHLVVEALAAERPVAALPRQHRERGPVAKPDRPGGRARGRAPGSPD